MHDDTPVIKRLLRSRSKNDDSKERPDDIILWCRFMDGSRAQPYICLGRLGYVSHQSGVIPVEFMWELLDYKNLEDKTLFQQVIHY